MINRQTGKQTDRQTDCEHGLRLAKSTVVTTLRTWVQSLKPTWRRERTDSQKLFFGFHRPAVANKRAFLPHRNKQ